jgi:hypothetical protein
MTHQSDKETKTRAVNDEELRLLGFSERDIADAKRMEDLGLFKMEPSPDMVEKTLKKCIPLLPKPKRPDHGT